MSGYIDNVGTIVDVCTYSGGYWGFWGESSVTARYLIDHRTSNVDDRVCYKIQVNANGKDAAELVLTAELTGLAAAGSATYTPFSTTFYSTDPTAGGTQSTYGTGSESAQLNTTVEKAISAAVPAAKVFTGSATVYAVVRCVNTSQAGYIKAVSAAVRTVPPDLVVSISPATVYANSAVTLSFGNTRADQTLTVNFSGPNSTTFSPSYSVNTDTASITCPESWFEDAGVTGVSMQITVTVTDPLGRTATGSFTLRKPQSLSATPIAPRSTTVDGDGTISFGWSTSGEGTQVEANLQWSQDNLNWTNLHTLYNSDQIWPAPALTFPGGTIYWRVRVTNNYSVVGAWSSSVSFTVRYTAVSQVVPVNSPTEGVINAANTQIFQIAMEASAPVYTPFTVASASFFWRAGTSGNWTEVGMTPNGSSAAVSITGGTFSLGTVQWYAQGTDNTGRTTATDVYTLTAITAEVAAIPVRPINTLKSASSEIVFAWEYFSVTGSPQSSAQLQKSTDGTTWSSLATVTGTATSWTAPANIFSAGTVYWRVRAFTSGGSANPDWSESVSFECLAAPVIDSIVGNGVPCCTITWQVDGQVSYRLRVDDRTYGPYFGPNVRTFSLQEPLPNGWHVVAVQAQNKFGLWSEWTEADVFTANSPGTAFALTAGVSGPNVILGISGGTPGKPYLIYRDGVLIGKTSAYAFADRVVVGTHVYDAVQMLPGGYYTRSSTQPPAAVSVRSPVIAALSGSNWIELRLSENPRREQGFSQGRQTASVYYSGARYPEVEIGLQESLSGSGDVSWTYAAADAADAFEALIGRPVIYKTPGGVVIVGVLDALKRTDKRFYKSFTFSVTQMNWRDFVDES